MDEAAQAAPAASATKVQQPKPQALPSRAGPSSILVSPRQKGNPILNSVRTVAWEYSDIPADYVLGSTTCALFLSLKYHRLHPEYIYNRIRDLKGQYQLRLLLTMVDIENHDDSLRELSKTSLVNNVTIILAWSAQEAGRYLELFKTFEHAAPTSIKAQQSTSYSDKLVEFITVPRSINKTDALGLVSNFGSVRTAVNAGPEEIGLIAGWGEKKVQRWCNAVREPFRLRKAAKRGLTRDNSRMTMSRDLSIAEGEDSLVSAQASGYAVPQSMDVTPSMATGTEPESSRTTPAVATSGTASVGTAHLSQPGEDEVVVMRQMEKERSLASTVAKTDQPSDSTTARKRKQDDEEMSEGIMAALTKLRQK